MNSKKKISVADVRASFNSNIVNEPTIRWFGRPLANLITPFFHNTGWTANRLTIARIYLSIVGILFLAVPVQILWQISALIYFLGIVLDCVDGNLARLQDDTSYFGKFLDGVADGLYPQTATFFLGVGAWQFFGEPLFIVVGAMISIICLGLHMIRNRLSFFREWMVSLCGPLTEKELENAQRPKKIQHYCSLISVNGHFLAFLCLLIPQWGLWMFFGVVVLAQLLTEFVWILTTLVEAGAILKRHRISRHLRVTAP
jgi:phosphatidylglycerophosphate synthase